MTGFIVATAVMAVASAAYTFFAATPSQTTQDEMAPANLDAFNPTTCEEGRTVPLVIGTARVSGNLLYYGGLRSQAHYDEVESGGKGGGGSEIQSVLRGYSYYLDMWQAICRGPVEILTVYKNDDPISWETFIDENDVTLNDGTGATYPSGAGEFATKLPGITHVWMPQFPMGFNSTNTPTLHFVVKDKISTPVQYSDLPNGKNPAAAIYILLLEAGLAPENVDLDSFNAAAAFWEVKGYGINFSVSKQQTLEESVKLILGWVGGYLFEDSAGNFRLKAHDPDAEAVATITDADVFASTFQRRSWDDTPNVFTAKFTDQNQDFSTRTVLARNPASVALLGREKSTSVDLSCFIDEATGNARLWELMKRDSYPSATLEVTLGLQFAHVDEGDVVTVNLDEYGISGLECAVQKKSFAAIDKGEVCLSLLQVPERIYDDFYTQPGNGSQWSRPDYTPVPLTKTRIMELPRTAQNGATAGLIILAARESLREDGLGVMFSTTGTDYSLVRGVYTWSQYGTLEAPYNADTFKLDDQEGIRYRPYREDPTFSSLSREDFFDKDRYAIIGNEILKFQGVELQEDGTIKLTGIMRGLFHTPVEDHAAGEPIWLTRIGDAALTRDAAKRGFYKLVPSISRRTPDISTIDPIQVTEADDALVPWPVARIEAVRTGNSIALKWWPADIDLDGAGVGADDEQVDQWPPTFTGDFIVDGNQVEACEATVNRVGAASITIAARQLGRGSAETTITVPDVDGTYYS